jgi:rhamnogalacturonan endolyase
MKKIYSLLAFCYVLICNFSVFAQRKMENLDRALVAVRTSASQVYIGWKMLGTDPAEIGFNVYRGSVKINTTPITTTTNIIDNTTINDEYTVRPVINNIEYTAAKSATVWSKQFLEIPLQQPAGGTSLGNSAYTYTANDASVGDVDGDGTYEIFLKWEPTNAKDNSQSGYTGDVIFDCYKMDGRRLWRINLGKNIRAGAHYTQFLVYDFDNDGKAEMVCKTADGTLDGKGVTIGNATADYRNSSGYVLSGPEYLTIFNGQTGAAMHTTAYIPARGTVSSWGDNYGNRVDRFIATVAYCDGINPSIVMGRGYYTRMVRAAWDFKNGQLIHRWTFDSNTSGNGTHYSMGNHQLMGADVNGDGIDEITSGSSAINGNGTRLFANGLGHGDAMHIADIDPDRSGLEVWQCLEDQSRYVTNGLVLRDGMTGSVLWGVPSTGDIGRALSADVDPRYKGYECWGATGGLFTNKGVQISTSRPSFNHAVWWDADLQRELLDGTKLEKWNYNTNSLNRILTLNQASLGSASTNNGTKANPCLTADLLGDWREEILMRSADNQKLLLYTTTNVATNRIYTLMHDPNYRLGVSWQNVVYNQPPHTGFYIGEGMSTPPTPNIVLVNGISLLPITLQSFTASADGNKVSLLQWTTATEINGKHFIVQRSADGSNFTDIATVAANGNTSTAQQYTFTDNAALQGKNYYRLKLIATDAVTTFSNIQLVNFVQDGLAAKIITPNPFTKNITLQVSAIRQEKLTITLYNMAGKALASKATNMAVGSQYITLSDLSALANGSYVLEIKTDSYRSTEQVVKM